MLKLFGWKVSITAPTRQKCVICVAPHTSNYDFLIGLASYKSLGRNANFLMKKFWFFFPLKYILTSLGGIPVVRKNKKTSLTQAISQLFKSHEYVNLAVTPEGTRSLKEEWHTGFLYIAYDAKVPIQLGVIDYENKEVIIDKEFIPNGNIEADMQFVKDFYAPYKNAAKYPEKFSV